MCFWYTPQSVVGCGNKCKVFFFDGPFLAEARAGRGEEEHLRVLDRKGKRHASDTLSLLL